MARILEMPPNTTMVNISVDAIHSKKRDYYFPKAQPFIVKQGYKIVITTHGVYEEKDDGTERAD